MSRARKIEGNRRRPVDPRVAELQSKLKRVAKIDLESTIKGVKKVHSLSLAEKEGLCDEIFRSQPNLLLSVISLKEFGVSLEQIEAGITILLSCIESARAAGVSIPQISESVQDICLGRLVGYANFTEGLSAEMQSKAVGDQILHHPEVYLFSLAIGHLKEKNLLRVKDDAEKMLILCVLNIVETIAYAIHDGVTTHRV